MNTALVAKDFQYQAWAVMVREQAESGLSVSDWCEQNSINKKSFYYRRKRLREEYLQDGAPSFVRLMPGAAGPAETQTSTVSAFCPQLTVSLNDTVIGVTQDTPPQLLEEVLRVIRHA